ncbi:MAG: hypothetical protein AB8B73_06750 [Ekhidna sp.]
MKKATIQLILGSIVTAILLIAFSTYFGDHTYFQEIYDTVFILGTMHFFYCSGKASIKVSKPAKC